MNEGRITQVMGAVIDVEFEDSALPPIYNALQVTNPTISDKEWNLILEVPSTSGKTPCAAWQWTAPRGWCGAFRSGIAAM